MAARFATVAEVRSVLGAAYDAPVVTDAQIQSILDDLGCIMSVCAWDECLSVGSKYAAAHCVATGPGAQAGVSPGAPGLISSMKDGPASVSLGVTAYSADDSEWSTTRWGRKYLELRKAIRGKGSLLLGVTPRSARPF